jgi:ribosomal peptide maturation radical SAM protein 1
MDVCLTLLPYIAIERPSLALGLLKSALTKAGIQAKVLYTNLLFAETIGVDVYKFFTVLPYMNLLAEWTFSHKAFPEFSSDHDAYLLFVKERLIRTYGADQLQRYLNHRDFKEIAFDLRESASQFIDEVTEAVLSDAPGIVGCSSSFQQHCASLALLRQIKQRSPDTITILGGANCEGSIGQVTHANFDWVDYVVSGEAEEIFPKLCQRFLDQGADLPAHELPEGVLGPCHRKNSGQEAYTTRRAIVYDLDQSPVPDYQDYFDALYNSGIADYVHPGLLIETSRGCWWGEKHHCAFCGVNDEGVMYRSKSPRRVVDEFRLLAEQYQLKNFEVVDNILNLKFFDTVIPELANASPPYHIAYETPANLTRAQMQALAAAGIHWIQAGIESLHHEILTRLNKSNKAWTNVELLKWARECGVYVFWTLLYDIPNDEDIWYQEMNTIIPLLIHLQPPVSMNPIHFTRFSPYHERPKTFDMALVPFRTYRFVYALTNEDIEQFAWVFEKKLTFKDLITVDSRHGRQALWHTINQWKTLWWNGEQADDQGPELSIRETSTGLELIDTRPCAVTKHIRLEGFASVLYKICETATTSQKIMRELERSDYAEALWEDVRTILEEFEAQKILLELDNHFLSLAVKENCAPLNTVWPGGRLALDKIRRIGVHDNENTE